MGARRRARQAPRATPTVAMERIVTLAETRYGHAELRAQAALV
jgi:hypothetical protein